MKNLYLLLSFLLLGGIHSYAQETIVNPSYEFRNSGIYRIGSIELSPQATVVKYISEFIPGWWVQFTPENIYIENPADGTKYFATAIQGIEWGQQKPTPASGVDTFLFTFPPLPQGIKEINLIDESSGIYGINLDPKHQPSTAFPEAFIGNWYDQQGDWQYGIYERFVIYENKFWEIQEIKTKGKNLELTLKGNDRQVQLYAVMGKDGRCRIGLARKGNTLYTKQPFGGERTREIQTADKEFFQPGSKAVIQGYMKGYDPRAGYTTGLIYHNNAITSEDFPTVVRIQPDGRFETQLTLDFPSLNSISFGRHHLTFYVTPGDSLMIYIEWEDFLLADRYRDRQFSDFKTLHFMGERARTNQAIAMAEVQLPNLGIKRIDALVTRITPSDFLAQQTELYHRQLDAVDSLARKYHFTEEAQQVLQSKIYGDIGLQLLSFAMYREEAPANPQNKILSTPLEPSYFDFLKLTDLNNPYLFVPYGFRFFINRMEFHSPLQEARNAGYPQPGVSMDEYALENFPGLTPEEKDFLIHFPQTTRFKTDEELKAWQEKNNKKIKIYERYEKEIQEYVRKYVDPLPRYTEVGRALLEWKTKDSIQKDVLGLDINLVYQSIKFHDLIFHFQNMSVEQLDTLIQASQITHPYIQSQIQKQLDKKTHLTEGYSLPEGKATDVFRQIVDPYKGKIVFVDFWATSCGPCRAGINRMKSVREKYKDSDVAFVFITDENSSPLNAYNAFMKDVEGYKYRIPESDYNYLRELFHFNGIPRYVLLDREGKVLDDNYPGNPDADLEKLLKK